MERLKEHIRCSELRIGSIQHVTITQEIDVHDADVKILKAGADPEYYAIWKLIRSAEYNDATDEMEEAKTITFHDGEMSVPSFKSLCEDGIDPMAAENDDIKYSLTSHPVFSIGEVCLDLYLERYGEDDNPKEFYESEFETTYLDNMHFGNERGAMTSIAEDKVSGLLDFGLEHGILDKDPDVVQEREYKIMWGSEDAGEIKSVAKSKFIDSKVPEETGRIAFSRAKEVFVEGEHTLDDFSDE